MKIRALQALTIRDNSGALNSIAYGAVSDVSSELGAELISEGLAEEYTLLSPTGSVSITANGTVDVTEYASAVVNVGEVTLSYDVNGGTGSIASVSVIAGGTVTLDSGATLTAPEGKEFAGWATASDATEPDATSPYKVSSNTALYAVWDDVT